MRYPIIIAEVVLALSATANMAASSPAYLREWGGGGTGPGKFYGPNGIAKDPSGNIYVVDNGNDRIQKFTPSGQFVTQWGGYGSGDGQFDSPTDICVGPSGSVYATDGFNYRIQKYDPNGSYLQQWGTRGTGDGQFEAVCGVACDADENVYVIDADLNRVQKFSSSGSFISTWGGAGTGPGQFRHPLDLIVDSGSQRVYVTDPWNHRVQVFTSAGAFLTSWYEETPTKIGLAPNGDVLVTDELQNRVRWFTPEGTLVLEFGTTGSGPGQFSSLKDVVASDTELFVSDAANHRVQVFSIQPTAVQHQSWGRIKRLYR